MSTQGKFEPSYPTLAAGITLFLLWLTQPSWRLSMIGIAMVILAGTALKEFAPQLNTNANNTFKHIRKYPTAYGIAAFLATLAIVFAPAWSPWFAGILRNGGKDVSTIDIINKFGLLFGGAMGFAIAVWRAWCQDRQTKVEEQGLITERIIKATEQLGSPEMAVRIGGIYSLWRTAMDSPLESDKRNILDILCAFIRMEKNNNPITEDIQTAFNLIGNRNTHLNLKEKYSPNFNGAHLCKINGSNLDLSNTTFCEANLHNAVFRLANLENTIFNKANLEGSTFRDANLTKAQFKKANLVKSHLRDTTLTNANFSGANIQYAYLRGAKMNYSNLKNANLIGAKLHRARLKGANLYMADLRDTNIHESNYAGADFTEATLPEGFTPHTDNDPPAPTE